MTDFEVKLIVRCLTGKATDREQETLKEWLVENDHRVDYEQVKKIWITSGEVYTTYSPDLVHARKRIQTRIDEAARLNLWKWVGRAAAILIAVVGLIWSATEYIPLGTHQVSMREVTTGSTIGSVMLSDGSTIWLNKETTLKFPDNFTGAERRVFLIGEAFFKVAHNAEKPFVVEAGGAVTKVLGTSFNVKSSEDHVSVAVRTGKVLFSERDNSENFELLGKNEMAAFSYANHAIQKSTMDGSDLFSWRSHLLAFKNTALSEVVEKLSAYYDTSIQLDPAISGNLSLTTSFEDQSVEEVLQVVCVTLGLTLENTSDGYLLVRAKSKE